MILVRRQLIPAIVMLIALPAAGAPAGEVSTQALTLASLWPDSAALSASLPSTRPARISRVAGGAPGGVVGMLAVRGEVAGTLAGRRNAPWIGGHAAGSLAFARSGGPTLELRTQVLTTRRPEATGTGGLRTEALARFGEVRHQLRLGAGVERDLGTEDSPTHGLFSIGFAPRLRDIAMDVRLEESRRSVQVTSLVALEPITGDTLEPVPVLVVGERDVSAVSARLGTRWQRGRWMLESVAGVMVHRFAAPRRWAQSSLSLGLGRDLAVCATVGSPAPRWLALEPAAERRASLGLRLSPGSFAATLGTQADWPASPTWTLIRARHGWSVIQIRAPGARRVELIGDFTGWEPVSLRRMAGSRWELGLTLEPGVHRVNLRVDGGPWTPPAGLPTTPDGFDGVAGVVVVE